MYLTRNEGHILLCVLSCLNHQGLASHIISNFTDSLTQKSIICEYHLYIFSRLLI